MSTDIVKNMKVDFKNLRISAEIANTSLKPMIYEHVQKTFRDEHELDDALRSIAECLFDESMRFWVSSRCSAHKAYVATWKATYPYTAHDGEAYDRNAKRYYPEFSEYRADWCERYVEVLKQEDYDCRKYVPKLHGRYIAGTLRTTWSPYNIGGAYVYTRGVPPVPVDFVKAYYMNKAFNGELKFERSY